MTEFSLQQINQGDVEVLSLCGYMGNDEFYRLEKELSRLLEQNHRRVILDMAMLSFVTTVSLARLLVCEHEFHRRGVGFKLAGLSSSLSRVAELVGFDRKTDFQPDVATALKAFSRPPGQNPPAVPKERSKSCTRRPPS